jgi:hypothetical protein
MAKETGNCLHEPLPRTDTDVTQHMKGIRVLFMAELNPYNVLLETLTVHQEVAVYFMEPHR